MRREIVTFNFEKCEAKGREVVFTYSYTAGAERLGEFAEKLIFPFEIAVTRATNQILKYLHLLSGVSYYKSLLGEVKTSYDLSQAEAEYLNTIYHQGLGEFAYVNNITAPIKPFAVNTSKNSEPFALQTAGALLGVGGGKDSIVAGELLKELNVPTTAFSVASRNHHGQADKVIELLGLEYTPVERHVDISIVDFTKQHEGYNGHIPLSALLAWIGLLIAEQEGLKYVVVANESGSSEDNLTWNDRTINHQWSKSLEFESLTQDFIHTFVTPNITYLSLIRPFSSIKTIKLLVETGDKYLQTFTSCNLVLRIDPTERPNGRWCTKCAKCLSTFLLLTVFLPYQKVVNIFGSDLLEDETLAPMLRELVGLEGNKPLDCVGTTEELRAATRNLLENKTSKKILTNFNSRELAGPSLEQLVKQQGDHRLPQELSKTLGL